MVLINLRSVSTKLNKYIVFTMQTYKKLTKHKLQKHMEPIVIKRSASFGASNNINVMKCSLPANSPHPPWGQKVR